MNAELTVEQFESAVQEFCNEDRWPAEELQITHSQWEQDFRAKPKTQQYAIAFAVVTEAMHRRGLLKPLLREKDICDIIEEENEL